MLKSWSASKYKVYKQCPYKYKLQYINKIVEPPNEAMERGSKIHQIAESYITMPGRRLVPDELVLFSNLFKDLRKRQRKVSTFMVVEEMWCFKKDWSQTVWNDWAGCWLRVKLDTAWCEDDETMIVNDWKTGKYRPDDIDDYLEQLQLYALAAFLMYEHIKVVKPRLSYLDHGIVYPDVEKIPIVFKREQLPELQADWEKKTWPMLNDVSFVPRPNRFCGWCFHRKENKGLCKF